MKKRIERERARTASERDKTIVVRGNRTRPAPGFGVIVAISVSAAVRMGLRREPREETATYAPTPPGTRTFNKDIAPIIFNRCAGCHHPGLAAPFDLLSSPEVRKALTSSEKLTIFEPRHLVSYETTFS